jgi:hypothetical protein
MLSFANRCRSIRPLLSDRVDAPLSRRDEKRVTEHLEQCEACRSEYAFYVEIKAAAGEMDVVRPPAYLWERIVVGLDEHPWGEDQNRPGIMTMLAGFINGHPGLVGAVVSVALILLIGGLPAGFERQVPNPYVPAVHETLLGNDLQNLSAYMIVNGDRFPIEVQDYYLRHAEGLDQQIRTIKSALAQYPNNRQIQAQLAIAYGQKIRLYQELESSTLRGGHVPDRLSGEYDKEDHRYE